MSGALPVNDDKAMPVSRAGLRPALLAFLLSPPHAYTGQSVDGAGCSIERERRGYCVRYVIPASVKSHAAVVSSRWNVAVVTHVGCRDVGTALCFIAIPELRDRLPVGECPGQRPVGQGNGSCVVDGDGCSKATLPLTRNCVVNGALGSAP